MSDRCSDNQNRLVSLGLLNPDGTRLVGSPSARAWIPTEVPPLNPRPIMPLLRAPDQIGKSISQAHFLGAGITDGYWEFVQLLKLLSAAKILPKEFRAGGDFASATGIPAFACNMEHSYATHFFKDLAKGLRVLELKLVSWSGDQVARGSDLFVLKRWIREVQHADTYPEICQKDNLEVLSLSVPLDWRDPERCSPYEHTAILSNIDEWVEPRLTNLHLKGFAISFENLERLLFVNLPRLRILRLGRIILKDGLWDDIIEELSQALPLKSCKLDSPLLYRDFSYYTSLDEFRHGGNSHQNFMAANEAYALKRGTHPRSPEYVPSKHLLEQTALWNEIRLEGHERGLW
ncbi:MAG: hypothetical protein Q9213_001151 [Squamulea squamosa]